MYHAAPVKTVGAPRAMARFIAGWSAGGLYLAGQLRYWAGPRGEKGSRCCRILRRLTVPRGTARRGNECRLRRYRIIDSQV